MVSRDTVSFWLRAVISDIYRTSDDDYTAVKVRGMRFTVLVLCSTTGDKDWNVGVTDHICLVLCKGCHSQVHGHFCISPLVAFQ